MQMAPDYDHLTLMQKVEVFEHAVNNTAGDDLAKLLWLKSPSSEVRAGLLAPALLSGLLTCTRWTRLRDEQLCTVHRLLLLRLSGRAVPFSRYGFSNFVFLPFLAIAFELRL